MRVVVEDRSHQPALGYKIDAIAEGVAALGHEVVRWRWNTTHPECDYAFWWSGDHKVFARHHEAVTCPKAFVEHGWIDRKDKVHVDKRGVQAMCTWADEPLSYTPRGPMPVPKGGDLLVCLRHEHSGLYDGFFNPFFGNNRSWVAHLMHACPLPMRLRAHPESGQLMRSKLRQQVSACTRMSWDTSGSFQQALQGACAVACVDSTAGIEALAAGVPVLCFGRALYRHPGVSLCCDNNASKTLRFIEQLQQGRVDIDTGAVGALMQRLVRHQWNCNDPADVITRLVKLGL